MALLVAHPGSHGRCELRWATRWIAWSAWPRDRSAAACWGNQSFEDPTQSLGGRHGALPSLKVKNHEEMACRPWPSFNCGSSSEQLWNTGWRNKSTHMWLDERSSAFYMAKWYMRWWAAEGDMPQQIQGQQLEDKILKNFIARLLQSKSQPSMSLWVLETHHILKQEALLWSCESAVVSVVILPLLTSGCSINVIP